MNVHAGQNCFTDSRPLQCGGGGSIKQSIKQPGSKPMVEGSGPDSG